MPYCSRCGVEVDKNSANCPLCDTPIQHFDSHNRPVTYFPNDIPIAADKKKYFHRGSFSLLVSILFFIPIAIIIAADMITWDSSGTVEPISWSAIPVSALLASWCLIIILLQLYKSPLTLGIALFADVALFLFALSQVIPGTSKWFLPLGLSIAATAFLLILLLILYSLFTKKKGFNILGAVLLMSAILCISIDLFVSRYLSDFNKVNLTWSWFVSFSCLPVALFFFYLHYYKKVSLNFRRLFHV